MNFLKGSTSILKENGIFLALFLSFVIFVLLSKFTISLPIHWDTQFMLDGSYRVYSGLVPNKQFSNPIGPLFYFIGGVGMKLIAPTIFGFEVGWTMFMALLTLMSFGLRNQTSKPTFLLVIFILFIISVSPRLLSYDDQILGYVGLYNRISYAILFLISYLIFLPDKPYKIYRGYNSFVAGVLLCFLFLIKITFFAAGIALVFLGYLLEKKYLKKLSIFFGFFVVLILSHFLIGDYLHSYIRDLIIVAEARNNDLFFYDFFISHYLKETWKSSIFVFVSSLYFLTQKNKNIKVGYFGLIILIISIFLNFTIMQKPEDVLVVLFSIIAIDKLNRGKIFHKIIILFAVIFILLFVKEDLGFVTKGFTSKPFLTVHSSRKDNERHLDKQLINIIKSKKPRKILSVGENNLYYYHFLLKPPSNDILYWHNLVTFDKEILGKEFIFSDTNVFDKVDMIVFSSKYGHRDSIKTFKDFYADQIDQNFNLTKKKDRLEIYIRK